MTRGKRMVRISWSLLLVGLTSISHMDTAYAEALNVETIASVANTARSMCLSGSQYDLEVNADGSLSLLKLEPGAEGKVRITQTSGTGGALNYRDEGKRVDADKNIIGCISQNLPVLLSAAGAQLAAPSAPKSCRIAANGVERYQRELDITRDSGWRGGGYDPVRWCNDLVAILAGENPDGKFVIKDYGERKKSFCQPFNCPQYLYTCTVHVQSAPIYKEATSSLCP